MNTNYTDSKVDGICLQLHLSHSGNNTCLVIIYLHMGVIIWLELSSGLKVSEMFLCNFEKLGLHNPV